MTETYRLSFTFGGLLFPETALIARRFKALPDWDALRIEAREGTLLRKTREASRSRYFREIRERLKQAWPFEVDLIADEGAASRHACLAVCCRYYPLVGEFVREVLSDKVAMRDDVLGYSDYFHFMQAKSVLHPELAELAETTKTKLRTVTFRMLVEGRLLEKGKIKRIKVAHLPAEIIRMYQDQGDTLALDNLLCRRRTR